MGLINQFRAWAREALEGGIAEDDLHEVVSMTAAELAPKETVPEPTATVPEPAETVPEPTETVPEPTETVPEPTETVPEPTETVPEPTESPGTSGQ